MKTVCCQITRGVGPQASPVAAVIACYARNLEYRLISGYPAALAKNAAAQIAYEKQRDLILIEDDILVETEQWDRACQDDGRVKVCSTMMRNGEINVWFQNERLVYAGTVFLKVPYNVLQQIGDPWFQPRDLEFNGANGGEWRDVGPNADGEHSDTWFFYRCWQENIRPEVIGSCTHLLTPFTMNGRRLDQPIEIKPLGMMNCTKTFS